MRSLIPILWLAAAVAGAAPRDPAPEEVALRAANASVAAGALSKRYECVALNGSTAEPLFVSQETAAILVTIDAAATLPVTHAPAAVPPYRLVRLRRAGGEWRVESVALPEDEVAALAGIGRERVRLGDAGARDVLEQAREMATRLGEDRIAAMAMLSLGILVERGGEFSKALQLYGEAVRRAERAGDRVETARVLAQTGSTYAAMNDPLLGYDFIHRGLDGYREAHNVRGVIR